MTTVHAVRLVKGEQAAQVILFPPHYSHGLALWIRALAPDRLDPEWRMSTQRGGSVEARLLGKTVKIDQSAHQLLSGLLDTGWEVTDVASLQFLKEEERFADATGKVSMTFLARIANKIDDWDLLPKA